MGEGSMDTGVSRLVTGLCGYEDTTTRRWWLKTKYSSYLFLYSAFLFGFVVFVADLSLVHQIYVDWPIQGQSMLTGSL